jgi:hypothetical protein
MLRTLKAASENVEKPGRGKLRRRLKTRTFVTPRILRGSLVSSLYIVELSYNQLSAATN